MSYCNADLPSFPRPDYTNRWMSTIVTTDLTTGAMVHATEHRFPMTFVNDVAYLSLMVWVYDQTGLNRIFIRLPEEMISNPVVLQAVRYGSMFGSMIELRRWLNALGLNTDLNHYI